MSRVMMTPEELGIGAKQPDFSGIMQMLDSLKQKKKRRGATFEPMRLKPSAERATGDVARRMPDTRRSPFGGSRGFPKQQAERKSPLGVDDKGVFNGNIDFDSIMANLFSDIERRSRGGA